MRGILEILQFILSDKNLDGAGRSLRHILDNNTFIALQMKSLDPKQLQITRRG